MNDGYRWDIFISYRRTPRIRDWVHGVLLEELRDWLPEQMSRDPRIFVDEKIEVGTPWPDELEHGLKTSRTMLCVWSPTYFRSEWCKAEWASMADREDQEACRGSRPRILYPLLWQDGDLLPERARNTQYRDVKRWSHLRPEFRSSAQALAFTEEMQVVCQELATMISSAPSFRADFPIQRPVPSPTPPSDLPRLA